jgi:hypothetical protein
VFLRPKVREDIELLLVIWALLNMLVSWWFARIPR